MTQHAIARLPRSVLVAAVLAILAAGLAGVGFFGGALLPARTGPPVETLTIERTVLAPGTIELTVRNGGPDPVTVAQVSVNDSFVDLTGGEAPIDRLGSSTLRMSFPWQDGMPYNVALLTSSGVVIEHEIPVAVATPSVDASSIGSLALLGALIGIVPVLLGMTVLPVLRRAGPAAMRVLIAVTVGLLGFLAVDATIEGFELGATSGGAFGGPVLLVLGAALAFLALAAVEHVLPRGATGSRLALLIAIGIGLHNLGEGLAVGSAFAVGELALGSSLVFGFAAHNTTEGIAVVAPLARDRVSLSRLVVLGLIAGAPAILGTVLGATVTTPTQATFLLGLGIGAIAQVVALLGPQLRTAKAGADVARGLDGPVIGGLIAGVLVMYLTGLLVTA